MKKGLILTVLFSLTLTINAYASKTIPQPRGIIGEKIAEMQTGGKPQSPKKLLIKKITDDKECETHLLVRDFKTEFSALPKAKNPRLLTITFQSDMYQKCLDFLWWEPMRNRAGSHDGISVDVEESIFGFYKYTIEIDLTKTPAKDFVFSATTGETGIRSIYFEVSIRPEKWIAELSK